MNIKYIALVIIIVIISFILFSQKISLKKENINNLGIFNYMPTSSEISLISNAKNFEINKFIKDNVPKNKKNDFIILRNGIYSFLGFNLQANFKDIYDGEISISSYEGDNKKKDLLLIIKVKDDKDINSILNIDDNLNSQNKIVEFKRTEKINFFKYAFRTEENYIIFSSNKDLIKLSISYPTDSSNQNKVTNLPKEFFDKNKNKLIIISNKNLINTFLGKNYYINDEYFISFLNIKNNKLNLKSFSLNNTNFFKEDILNNELINSNNEIIFTNIYTYLYRELPFLNINDLQKEIVQEIKNKLNNKILYTADSKKWLLAVQIKENENIALNDLLALNSFNKSNLEVDDIKYYVFSKDKLYYKDNNLNFEEEASIFVKEFNKIILISNDISYLPKNKMIKNFAQDYFDNNNIMNNQIFIDDQIFINNPSNNQTNLNYPILNEINLFTNNLFKLNVNNLKVKTIQKIPELTPNIFIESQTQLY